MRYNNKKKMCFYLNHVGKYDVWIGKGSNN